MSIYRHVSLVLIVLVPTYLLVVEALRVRLPATTRQNAYQRLRQFHEANKGCHALLYSQGSGNRFNAGDDKRNSMLGANANQPSSWNNSNYVAPTFNNKQTSSTPSMSSKTPTVTDTKTRIPDSMTNPFLMSIEEQSNDNMKIAQQWETEIQVSNKDQSDWKRVSKWLQPPKPIEQQQKEQETVKKLNDSWKVALAAAVVMGLGCEAVTQSALAALITFAFVFVAALRDPLAENDDENVVGPLTRIIGRSALQSYQVSQPKLKAVARAAVQGDERLAELEQQVEDLTSENQQLKLYVRQREWIDEHQSEYALEDLKALAQRNGVSPYSGVPKQILMMKLLQAKVLRLP